MDREKILAELELANDRLKRSQLLAKMGNWEYDPKTELLWWSDETHRLLGYQPGEVEPSLDFIRAATHPDDRDNVRDAFDTAVANKTTYDIERRIYRADRDLIFVREWGEVICDNDGEVIQVAGTIQDITDRRRAEAAAGQSEQQLRIIFDSVADGIVTTDRAGFIQSFNRGAEKIFGYNAGDVVGQSVKMLMPDEFATDHDSHMIGYEGTGVSSIVGKTRELLGLRKDGTTFPMDLAITPATIGDERVITGVIRDVTERKASEQALRKAYDELELKVRERTQDLAESEAMSKRVLNSVGEGIHDLDIHGVATFVNPAACEMLGYTEDELVGRRLHGMIHHSHPDGTDYPDGTCPVYAALQDGEVHTTSDEVFWRKDGSPIPVIYTSTPIKQRGKVIGAVVTFTDIGEIKRREQKVKEYSQELERSNEELQSFAYAASHDLQEPLRKIQAFSERLSIHCRDTLDEKGVAYIDRIVGSSTRMRHLIDDLLNYSRVTTEARPFVSTCLGDILKGVLDDLEIGINQAGAVINAGALPTIEADPTQMRQVLQNLVGNALKFRREGEPLKIEISGRIENVADDIIPAPEVCHFTVRDNGIGFEARFKERIFGVFERLHGRGEYPGTGIGLATCKKIIERHGGSIEADGILNGGASFNVSLPVKRETWERV